MRRPQRLFINSLILLALLSVCYSTVSAQNGGGFDAIAKHLKSRYQAKKRSIPFMGLARFAVRIVRPAGVKSFNVSFFEDLKDTNALPDNELNGVMRNCLSTEWQPLVSVRQRNGDQVYIYAAEAGKDIKLTVLVINEREAALASVKVNPDAVRRFIDNPKILGISLADNDESKALQPKQSDTEK